MVQSLWSLILFSMFATAMSSTGRSRRQAADHSRSPGRRGPNPNPSSRLSPDQVAAAEAVDAAYERLQSYGPSCRSLLKKHLTPEVRDALKWRQTPGGATLYDVIRSGAAHPTASVGVYAPDADAYTTFGALFTPIIDEYHGVGAEVSQPPADFGGPDVERLPPLDPAGKYVISTRIRCARTLAGFPFNPRLTVDEYRAIEARVSGALTAMRRDPELVGTYYPLDGMPADVQRQLIADHFLFKSGDPHLEAANACNFWPIGRGIFHNAAKTFLVWVNEEDHVRLISMQPGGDVGAVLSRLARGVAAVERRGAFARDSRLGWLTFCPTNLGSTIRASVHIRLPRLAARPDFKAICDRLQLQIRGVHGEHSESEGGVYDISNKARLGYSEIQAVMQMYDGVRELIRMEEQAEKEEQASKVQPNAADSQDRVPLRRSPRLSRVAAQNSSSRRNQRAESWADARRPSANRRRSPRLNP